VQRDFRKRNKGNSVENFPGATMPNVKLHLPFLLSILCVLLSSPAHAQTTMPAASLASGWSLLKEGEAEVTMEQEAANPAAPAPHEHLLQIKVTKTADPGKGRGGVTNSAVIEVKDDHWYDITFSAMTQTGTVGLVFSLESADGKVLARTTLPEIGRGRGGRGGRRGAASAPATVPAAPAAWPKYLVALHARAADGKAHLVIAPIEPTTIWLESLTWAERP
jgi:hypothetical protein